MSSKLKTSKKETPGFTPMNEWMRDQIKETKEGRPKTKRLDTEIRDLRKGNFYWIDRKILDEYGSKIGPTGIAIYNALCYFANNETQKAWPSMETIGKKVGCTRRTVIDHLAQMIHYKIIKAEKRKGYTKIVKLLDLK